MADQSTDLLDAIQERVPYDGPHSGESVIDAAAGVSALIRYLNNATGPWNAHDTLRYAATVDSILGGLAGGIHGLNQLFAQLATAMQQQADSDPTLYLYGDARPAGEVATELAGMLRDLGLASTQLAERIDAARTLSTNLGNND